MGIDKIGCFIDDNITKKIKQKIRTDLETFFVKATPYTDVKEKVIYGTQYKILDKTASKVYWAINDGNNPFL